MIEEGIKATGTVLVKPGDPQKGGHISICQKPDFINRNFDVNCDKKRKDCLSQNFIQNML